MCYLIIGFVYSYVFFFTKTFPYSHVMLLFLVPLSLPLLLNFRLSYLLTSVLHFHR